MGGFSLVSRPSLPDFISQLWRKLGILQLRDKIWEWPGDKARPSPSSFLIAVSINRGGRPGPFYHVNDISISSEKRTTPDSKQRTCMQNAFFRPTPPSVYLGRHWRHSHDKIDQAFLLLYFCILKRLKTGQWEGLGTRLGTRQTCNEAPTSCTQETTCNKVFNITTHS